MIAVERNPLLEGLQIRRDLGWFDDPLLSTFIRYPDTELARLLDDPSPGRRSEAEPQIG